MKKTAKLIALLLALTLLAATLSGCGGQEAKQTPAPETEAPAESAPEGEPAPTEEAPATEEPIEEQPTEFTMKPMAESAVSYPIYEEMTSFGVLAVANSIVFNILPDGEFYNFALPTEYVEADTNVHLDYTVWNDAAASEQLNLLIAGGDFPEIWLMNLPQRTGDSTDKLIEDDIIVNIADKLEENAPEWYACIQANSDYAGDLYTMNGNIGNLIAYSEGDMASNGGMYIRVDMIEAAGYTDFDPSKQYTMDEITEILRAVQSIYECKLPLLTLNTLGTGLGRTFNITADEVGSGLSYQLKEVGVADAVCTYATSNFRDYLELMQSYYAEGLLCDEYMNVGWALGTADSYPLTDEVCLFKNSTNLPEVLKRSPPSNPDYEVTAIADPIAYEGMTIETSSATSQAAFMGGMAISPACHDVEGFLNYLNYFFTTEGSAYVNFGLENVSYEYDDAGEIHYTEAYLNNPDYNVQTKDQYYKFSVSFPTVTDKRANTLKYSAEQLQAVDAWSIGRNDGLVVPGTYFTNEESEEMSVISGDVATYIAENAYGVVVGEVSLEQWDQCIAYCYSDMGLDRCEEMENTAMQRYIDARGW